MKKALIVVALMLVACYAQATDKWIVQYGEAEFTSCNSSSNSKGFVPAMLCLTSPKQTWCDTEDCVRAQLLEGNATHVWKLTCHIGGMFSVVSNPCWVEEYSIITAKDIKPKEK